MNAFTQEQQEILAALGKTVISYIGAVHRSSTCYALRSRP